MVSALSPITATSTLHSPLPGHLVLQQTGAQCLFLSQAFQLQQTHSQSWPGQILRGKHTAPEPTFLLQIWAVISDAWKQRRGGPGSEDSVGTLYISEQSQIQEKGKKIFCFFKEALLWLCSHTTTFCAVVHSLKQTVFKTQTQWINIHNREIFNSWFSIFGNTKVSVIFSPWWCMPNPLGLVPNQWAGGGGGWGQNSVFLHLFFPFFFVVLAFAQVVTGNIPPQTPLKCLKKSCLEGEKPNLTKNEWQIQLLQVARDYKSVPQDEYSYNYDVIAEVTCRCV